MPDSAVATGAVDMLRAGGGHARPHPRRARQVRLRDAARRGRGPRRKLDKIRTAICDILRSRLGHDFSQYKQQTFMRRVQRRMQVTAADQI